MSQQLAFDLPAREALDRDAFFVAASNALAVATLDNVAGWPSGKLALVGPTGSGKTHLAHVWARDHAATIVAAKSLASADIPALARASYVVVEDADKMDEAADLHAAEVALFHLHNLTLAEGGRLLITASKAPNHWSLTLPDLASRMQGTAVAKIEEPDDALLSVLLVKQFEDRQIAVPHSLVPYLIKRIERSAEAVRAVVEALDKAALAEGVKVSQKLAARVLDTADE